MTDDEISLRVVPIEGNPTLLSLNELVVKRVRDVGCHVAMEGDCPTLAISAIYFEDGTSLEVDGEHDIAYCYLPYSAADQTAFPGLTERLLIEARDVHHGFGPDDEEYEDPDDYDY